MRWVLTSFLAGYRRGKLACRPFARLPARGAALAALRLAGYRRGKLACRPFARLLARGAALAALRLAGYRGGKLACRPFARLPARGAALPALRLAGHRRGKLACRPFARLARCAALGALLVLIGCGGVQLPRARMTHPGQLLFNGWVKPEVDCWECHDGTGRGARAPDLSDVIPKRTDQQIVDSLVEGPGLMPDYGDLLSDGERQQILAWLRAEFGGPNQGR